MEQCCLIHSKSESVYRIYDLVYIMMDSIGSGSPWPVVTSLAIFPGEILTVSIVCPVPSLSIPSGPTRLEPT